MILKFNKFKANEDVEYPDFPEDPNDLYEKTESSKFIDDVKHLLDDAQDSIKMRLDYNQGYALDFGPEVGFDLVTRDMIESDGGDIDIGRVVGELYDHSDIKDMKTIVDCIYIFRSAEMGFPPPTLYAGDYFDDYQDSKHLPSSELSELSGMYTKEYKKCEDWYKSNTLYVATLQRILRLDDKISIWGIGAYHVIVFG